LNYYRHYIGDYGRDTAHLSLAEDGAYRRLLDHYYATEKPLPGTPEACYRICAAQTPAERAAVDSVLSQFFELDDGVYHNQRADREIPPAQNRIATAKANGRRGGRPVGKRTRTESDPSGNPIETQSVNSPTTNLQPPEDQPPTTNRHSEEELDAPPPVPAGATAPPAAGKNGARGPKSGPAWESYAAAYLRRYDVEPVRNASVNAHLCKLVDRLGAEEAPHVAAWYVEHPDALYVRSGHCTELLVRDAAKLRTQWATQRVVTGADAREQEGVATRGSRYRSVIDDYRREEETGGQG